MRKPKVLKLNTLILLALFMFTNVPQYPNFNFGEAIDLNRGSQKDFGSPISAARDFFYFSVNGTQLYEDGIYYCFQADILNLYLNTSSDIPHIPLGNVVLDISSFGSPIVFNYIGGGSGYKEWGYSLPIPSDKLSGNYNATLSINDGTFSSFFLFNISIMNPQPRILKTVFEDTVFGNGPRQIYDQELTPVYHFSKINISCNVVNDDELSNINSVKLEYQNGNAAQIDIIELVYKGDQMLSGYLTRQYALPALINIDLGSSSTEARSNWTIGNNFNFKILVDDQDIDREEFYFPWVVKVLNQPPSISQFSVTGDIGAAAFDSASMLNFYAIVDFTDLETDVMFGNTRYNYSQTFLPSRGHNGTGITGFTNNATDLIHFPNDGKAMQFVIGTGGEFFIDFNLGRNYDFNDNDLFVEWLLTLRFIIGNTAPALSLTLWDYSANNWYATPIGTNILQGRVNQNFSVQFLNESSYITNIKNFFDSVNQTNAFRLKLTCTSGGGGDPIGIDLASMMIKFNRKVGASDIIIKVFDPNTSYEPKKENEIIKNPGPITLNIKNLYDMSWSTAYGGASKWALNYSVSLKEIGNKYNYVGVWTFILEVYDFGAVSYNDINVEEINGINEWSQKQYSGTESAKRAMAVATKAVRVGLNWDQTINVENVIITNPEPTNTQNSTVSVVVRDSDYNNEYKNITSLISPNLGSFRIQQGLDWRGPYPYIYDVYSLPPAIDAIDVLDKYPNGDFKYVLKNATNNYTNPSNVLTNNTESYRFKCFESEQDLDNYNFTAYYVSFNLDIKHWLSKDNITGIWLNLTQNLDFTNAYALRGAEINFWNFQTERWVLPNLEKPLESDRWRAGPIYGGSNTLNKFVTDVPYGNRTWFSSQWDNITQIKDCIKDSQSNLMYMRVLMERNVSVPDVYANYNISIDFMRLAVQFRNEYTCKIRIWDNTENTPIEYFMARGTASSGTRTYNFELPTSLKSARSFAFGIEVQNGNTSIHYVKGQYSGQPAGSFLEQSNYVFAPYYNASLTSNQSYIIRSKASSVAINIDYATKTNLHRHIDSLSFNGTINPSKGSIDQLEHVYLQLRHYRMDLSSEWREFEAKNYLDPSAITAFTLWNNLTNNWNTSVVFGYDYENYRWQSGVFYYRLVVKTNESITNATMWGVFRLQNYQPKNIDIKNLQGTDDLGGVYRRVIDPISFRLSFVDVEGDNSSNPLYNAGNDYAIKILVNIHNRDTDLDEKWDSKVIATYNSYISNLYGNPQASRFFFDGSFNFSREIDIGIYNELYIRVEDLDPDWPQVGTLRITSNYFDVRNNPPQPSISLRTNSTIDNKDQVYRNNWFSIYCEIFDYDDFPEDITLISFNGTVINNSGAIIYRDYSSEFLFNSLNNPELEQWQINLFVDRYNKTGAWNFTANFFDPDGDDLSTGAMNLSVMILNNLPIIKNIYFENTDTGITGYLTNQTSFGAFRGNETIKIIADVYDVEDTWMPEANYTISEMNFLLRNEYSQLVNGPENYVDPSFVFNLEKNGSVSELDTQGKTTVYDPTSFSFTEWDPNEFQITSVKDENGDNANVTDLTSYDAAYHNISYIWSPSRPSGGEYFITLAGLGAQFDVHSIFQIVNISINYHANSWAFNIYAWNYDAQRWEYLDILNVNAWNTKTISLSSADLNKYTDGDTGNSIQLKINCTNSISPPGIGNKIFLYVNQVNLSYFDIKDMRYERWQAEITFPTTTALHAGEMKLWISLVDRDNGVGTDKSNIINIYNAPPRFGGSGVRVSIGDQFMTPGNEYWVNYTTKSYPQIEILVEALDDEGIDIGIQTISIYTKISDGLRTFLWSADYQAKVIKVSDQANLYKIIIQLNPENRPEGLNKITRFELISITVADFDFGFCDQIKFPSSAVISNIGIIINFREEVTINEIPTYVWIIVGVLGGVALISLSVLFYRKFISYKKYMRDDEW